VTHGLAAAQGPAVTGHQGVDALIGFAVALLLASLLAITALAKQRPKDKRRQLEAAYRQFSTAEPSADLPVRKRGPGLNILLAVLVILNVVWLGFLLYRAVDARTVESAVPESAASSDMPSSAIPTSAAATKSGSPQKSIQVENVVDSARPSQTVSIRGTYHGGANTFLRVQRLEGGKWFDFPLTTKTDQSGKFTAYVELGGPGRYQLRVLDPDSLVTSKTFILVIKG
jgi:hypothetical protein